MEVSKKEIAELKEDFDRKYQKLTGGPKWILYGVIALLAFLLIYLGWSMFHKKEQSTEVWEDTKPAVKAKKKPGPVIKVPIQTVPEGPVFQQFPTLPPLKVGEVFVDTAKIPVADNGGTAVVRADTNTGLITTQFKPNPPPWFAFEDKNYIGGAYRQSSQGASVPVWLKRDIAQVKGFFVQAEVGGIVPLDDRVKGEIHIQAGVEYRWRGLFPWSK